MLDIYLSDKSFKSILNKSEIYSSYVIKLTQTVESLDGLYFREYPNIKRLKSLKPTVWRYRIGNDRIIFTTISQPKPSLIIHKIAPRSTVYKQLPHYFPPELNIDLENVIIDDKNSNDIVNDTEFQDCDRYYKLPPFLINNHVNSEAITKFIIEGEYRFNPCLNSKQKSHLNQINPHDYLVYQIQGTAGTGKTTLAFFLADKVAKENIFPIIITPNKQLKKFGYQSLKSLNPDVNILDNEFEENLDNQFYDVALFSRNELIQKLAGDDKPTLTASQGCQIIRDVLQKGNNGINKFQHINIYGILQSFIIDENLNYPLTDKDALTLSYQNVIDFLKDKWKETHNKNFDEKDAISQGKKALNNLPNYINWLKKLTKNKSILLIIDEVQDFYWFQLKIFLDLAIHNQLSVTVILLGDENQRVTISGFSWANFRNIFDENYSKERLVNGINLTQNFRNTKQIATIAKYFLGEDFIKQIKINQKPKYRSLPETADSNQCYDDGLKPRLIKIDDQWLQDFLHCIEKDDKSDIEDGNIISQIIFLKRDLLTLSDEITKKFTDLEEKEIVTFYNISEAKGQEFEATVILFPFQISINQLGFDNLFEWYTAITRARYYQCILVREEELDWLKNIISNADKLNNLFEVYNSLNLKPKDFAEELKIHGQSLITIEQRRQKLVNNIVYQDLYKWLKRRILPANLTKKSEKLKLTWWQLLKEIINKLEEFTENQNLFITTMEVDEIIKSLDSSPILEIIIFYYVVKYLYYQEDLEIKKIIPIQREIVKLLQKKDNKSITENLLLDIKNIPFIDLKALILVANNLSWKAVSLLKEDATYNKLYNKELEIEEIALQLENKGLTYEGMRMRVKFLQKSPTKKTPFVEVLNQEGELVNLLCQSFINQLPQQ